MSHRQFMERLLIAIAIVALALLLWQLRSLLVLVFGAVLVAVIFRIIANPVSKRFGLPDGVALIIAVVSVLALS
ncbi:MAG: AI-2E family transporter, partial [Pseudomonadota bacterium]|nr:AI-2E family transporter [Pseudomonadota bacterium]